MGQGMGLEVKRVKEMSCQCHFEVLVGGLAVGLGEIGEIRFWLMGWLCFLRN